MFHEVINDYDDIVASVRKLDITERNDLVHIEARLVLVDGSELHASEVWIADEVAKYSYYWLEETGETIIGWDNAPHHEEIETFPHHEHQNGEVRPTKPMDAASVFEKLGEKLR